MLLCYVYANNDSHLDHFYSLLIHILQRLKHSRHHFAVELILTKIEGLVLLVYTWSVVGCLGVSLDIVPSLPHSHTECLT